MELRFSPLFSGSSGNATYVGCDCAHLLLDAGLSGSRVDQALRSIGISPEQLDAALVTHEHTDHIRGIGVLARKYNFPVYATEGTWQAMGNKIGNIPSKNIRVLEPESSFFIGPIEIVAFPIPHDARSPVGFSFSLGAARFAVATDLGCVRESWLKHVEGADAVLLESNYDPEMLEVGPYPYDLKRRILSKKGHLSNEDAGKTAVRLIEKGTRQIILGHLSKENNFPELALCCAKAALQEAGIQIGMDADLRVAQRDSVTGIFSLSAQLFHGA